MINPDPTTLFAGLIDIVVGALLLYTESALPEQIAMAHTVFLLYKGLGSIVEAIPVGFYPVFVLGCFADLLSAAILYFGQPPLLLDYQVHLSALLFLKGLWGTMGLLAA